MNIIRTNPTVDQSLISVSKEKEYSGYDIISAASNMTASGVLLSKIKPQEIDEQTKRFFVQETGLSDPYDIDDNYWNSIKRSALSEFLPQMQDARRDAGMASMSNKEVNYLMSSEGYREFVSRKNKIDRVAKATEVFANNPVSVFGASAAMSIVEPWNLASMPIALVKASSQAATAARFAGLGAVIATGEEALLRSDDPNRTLGVSLSSVALATTINGAIGTYLSRSKSIQQNHLKEIEKSIKSIDKEGQVVIDLENNMLDAASETINLNIIESAKELNKALKEIPGVGIKTAERILANRANRTEGLFDTLEDLFEEGMTASEKLKIQKIIDSKKFHANNVNNMSVNDEIVGAYGIEKIASITSPLVKLLKSPFPEVRRSAKELLDTPFLTTDNLKGIPSPHSLESVNNMNRKLGNDLIDDLESPYYSYLFPEGEGGDFARTRGGRTFRQAGQIVKNLASGNFDQLRKSPTSIPGKMSFDKFKLAALEHHTGAVVSKDPNVINAANGIKKFFSTKEADVKDLLIRLNKGIESNVTWIKNINYTHRIYNKRVIAENPEAFENFLVDQLVKKHGSIRNAETELQSSIAEIRTTFRNSIDNIAKSPEERIDLEKVFTPNKRGASHNRYWTFIDEADLYRTDFVVKDIESISNSYILNVLSDVNFYRKYGTLQNKEVVKTLKNRISKNKNLSKEELDSLDENLAVFDSMLQRVRGTYLDVNSPVPGGTTQNTLDVLKKFGNLRMGAFFGIKSAPDIGRSIMFLGFKKAFGPLMQSHFLKNQKALSLYERSSRELRSINVANEINFSSIISSLTNTHINSFSGNKVTDIIGKNNNAMFILNGLSLWNEFMKKNAGIGVLDEIIQSAKLSRAGKLPDKKSANLSKMGLSKEELEQVLVEFEKHGESYQGINLMNFDNWSKESLNRAGRPMGLSLADRVQLAVKKEVDTIIVTPGIGDTPLIMENSWVSIFTQYKSFPIAAVVRQTLPLAQNMDSNNLAGLLVAISASFAANQFVDYAKGNDAQNDTWEGLLWEALEDTGNLSTIGEFNNYAQMISSGNPMLLGPLGTLPQDMFKVQSGLANEDGMNPYEQRAAIRLTPYAGLLQILSVLPRAAGDVAETVTSGE